MLIDKQLLLFSTLNVFDSKSKNKSNHKKFNKFDKKKFITSTILTITKNINFTINMTTKLTIIMFRKIYFIINFFFIIIRKKNDNAIYFITSKIISSKSIRCRKCNINYVFKNKLHEHIKIEYYNKIVVVIITKIFSIANFSSRLTKFKSFNIIMITRNFNQKFKNFNDNKSLSINIENKKSFKKSLIFFDVSIIIFDVDYNKNVNINHEFRN